MSTQPGLAAAPPAPRNRRRRIWGAVVGLLVVAAAIRAFTIDARTPRPYLADTKPVVLAHAGAQGHAPANTLEGFALGLEQGADIIETDVHMTKDGYIVTAHDETIDRLTNGSGLIKEMTLADLRKFDFGYDFTPDGGKSFPYRGKGITIPTLEEVFQKFPGVRVNIELKQNEPAMEEQVWALVQKYKMEEKVLINSFMTEPGERWRKIAGDATAMGADKGDMYGFAAFWLTYLDWLYQPKVDAFQLPTSQKLGPVTIHLDSPRLLSRAHKLGIKVHYWTINDEAEMRRLLELGADGLITDYPDRAVKVLKEMGYR